MTNFGKIIVRVVYGVNSNKELHCLMVVEQWEKEELLVLRGYAFRDTSMEGGQTDGIRAEDAAEPKARPRSRRFRRGWEEHFKYII